MSEFHRGVLAMVGVSAIMLGFGFALGSMGLRDDMDALNRRAANLESDLATVRATAATNGSAIASMQALIDRADLARLGNRVARIDREVCLLRADQSGTISRAMQQECASR